MTSERSTRRVILGLNDNIAPPTSPLFEDLRLVQDITLIPHGRWGSSSNVLKPPPELLRSYRELPPGYPRLRITPQLSEKDCGVACLTMLAVQHTYEEVEVIISRVTKRPVPIRGMQNWEVIAAGEEMGMEFDKVRTFDFYESTGILNVHGMKDTEAEGWRHFVVLHLGLIFDTNCCVYRYDDFEKCFPHAEFRTLLRVRHL